MLKRYFFIAAAMILIVSMASGQNLINSAHDLSTGSTYTFKTTGAKSNIDQTCVFCHVPHVATGTSILWNRNAPAGPFEMYKPLSATTGTLGDASLRCLSCHDGVTALNSLIKNPTVAPTNNVKMDTTQIVGGQDLGNDHPVGFTIPWATTGWKASIGTSAKAYSNKVECSSCHDPHNMTHGKFLRASNAASAICTSCHNK